MVNVPGKPARSLSFLLLKLYNDGANGLSENILDFTSVGKLAEADRGVIKALHKTHSNRKIAEILNCSPTTIGNELKRGTPPRKSNKGKAPEYSPVYGQKSYEENRKRCRKRPVLTARLPFAVWVQTKIREAHWSLDACVGYAKTHNLFSPEEMTCTKTLYNAVWNGTIDLTPTELPKALKRKRIREKKEKESKKNYGKSIEERPDIASQRTEFGHWEGDTVVGTRDGKGPVVLTLVEKLTREYIAILIPGKTSEAVIGGIRTLRDYFGKSYFSKVFKTVTVDNGSEFSDFSQVETWSSDQNEKTGIYFAHPYQSTDRAQNENLNGMFRFFFPKGKSMEGRTVDEALNAADTINEMPRRSMNYQSPQEAFDLFLNDIYSTLDQAV